MKIRVALAFAALALVGVACTAPEPDTLGVKSFDEVEATAATTPRAHVPTGWSSREKSNFLSAFSASFYTAAGTAAPYGLADCALRYVEGRYSAIEADNLSSTVAAALMADLRRDCT